MKSSKTVIYAALVGNGAIAVTKFVAAAISGSSAMLTEGIHSLVDTGNQGLLLLGLRRSKKPADEQHPFGHGQELYFYAFVVAVLIFGVGGGISIYEGVLHILHPKPPTNLLLIFGVFGLAFLFELVPWYIALREFRRAAGDEGYWQFIRSTKDPTVFAVLFEDSAALAGIVVAAAGVGLGHWLQMPVLDGVASVLIGLILCGVAAVLIYETQGLLVGEAVEPHVRKEIRGMLEADPAVAECLRLATLHMGPDTVIVTADLKFADETTLAEATEGVARLEEQIVDAHPGVKYLFIEAASLRTAQDAAAS